MQQAAGAASDPLPGTPRLHVCINSHAARPARSEVQQAAEAATGPPPVRAGHPWSFSMLPAIPAGSYATRPHKG